jgi:hypothetical protein
MLMAFPQDPRSNLAIAKAMAGFGLLRSWHETKNIEHIVAKVNLHDDAKVPQAVTVGVALPERIKTWTCPVFVLKKKGVTMLGDEDPMPMEGLLHPLPASAPRWRGPTFIN